MPVTYCITSQSRPRLRSTLVPSLSPPSPLDADAGADLPVKTPPCCCWRGSEPMQNSDPTRLTSKGGAELIVK
eukprot:CAMPEP_0202787158 /NCGR_PEP_ID=MMETSP1388-20130828/71762_1 /ASSEMBLY_ACC=CAM_ASM_000864 /TAXON_ID=37098 /ORGANISM="Isochrysis sp, Strain CCMP1244" /LENGTH=72 /DNA_ID=CAMNT_0049456737 /DNA_START=47 /DNA_END=262 /DNA_ORIENTATION=+